jgi:uncharacterized protein
MIAQLASGHVLDTDAPDLSEVTIDDLALGLSFLYRWRGQVPVSVAQHSVLMARAASSRRAARCCLVHDASEVFMGDLPSPFRAERWAAGWERIEQRIDRAIAERFGLPFPWPAEVKRLDHRACKAEAIEYLPHSATTIYPRVRPLPGELRPAWSPRKARAEFQMEARRLGIA